MTLSPRPDLSPRAEDAIDAALRLLADHEPVYRGGLSDHGPMAVDALARLGGAWEVSAWACRYAERLEPARPETRERRAVLLDRVQRQGWKGVVGDVVPLLLPGMGAGAFHCAIRVAHAVRLLSARDAPERRVELAAALAYWIDARLPLGPPPRVDGDHDPRAVLATLPPPPPAEGRWLIGDRARHAAAAPGFAAHVDGVELPDEPVAALRALAGLGRDLLLAQPHAPIVYVHLITGPQAVAALVPLLDRTAAQEAVACTWQALAAIHAAYHEPGGDPGDEGHRDWASVVRAAVDSGDEHAIKGALACLEGDHHESDPRWRRAASRLARIAG